MHGYKCENCGQVRKEMEGIIFPCFGCMGLEDLMILLIRVAFELGRRSTIKELEKKEN